MPKQPFRILPQYVFLIAANAVPVYGAFSGKLVFFQVIWIYWVECLLLIGFDLIRIAAARGNGAGPDADAYLAQAVQTTAGSEVWTFWSRGRLMLQTLIIRALILAFYLVFLILFVGLQLTADSDIDAVARSMVFRDAFVNTALVIFIINGFVQLAGGFFLNGLYRQVTPRLYTNIFDARTIILHVVIVSTVVIHLHFFEGRSYAKVGEVVYVGIFMVIRTGLDIYHLRKQEAAAADPEPVIMI